MTDTLMYSFTWTELIQPLQDRSLTLFVGMAAVLAFSIIVVMLMGRYDRHNQQEPLD